MVCRKVPPLLVLQPPTAARRHEEYDDTLLSSVRRELDQSIAKHLDPGEWWQQHERVSDGCGRGGGERVTVCDFDC